MKQLMGIAYGRGCTANVIDGGPALAPGIVAKMFPDTPMIMVVPDEMNAAEIMANRFGENALIQKKIYNATPCARHVMIGGDHSVNFGHFARIADDLDTDDLCLIYIDAHLDIHTPESSQAQASGAPHGTNVRALLGDGDERWVSIPRRRPALRPENVFYIATRSAEGAEAQCVRDNNILVHPAQDIKTIADIDNIINEIRAKIGNRPYVVSFDFDAISPEYFADVLVPEDGGLTVQMAEHLISEFAPGAYSVEFVEYAPTGDERSMQIAHDLIKIALDV